MEFMKAAIDIAKKSENEIPVGAVIVKDGKIIAAECNSREKDKDITSHAEILAVRKAEKILNNWRLDECDIFVTLEPCPMCGWAIIQSRINNVYFGSYDFNYGSFSSKIDLRRLINTKINVYGGILEDECDTLLKDFFSYRRPENKIRQLYTTYHKPHPMP